MRLNGNYGMADLRNILAENSAEYFAGKGPAMTQPEHVNQYLEAVLQNPEKELFGVLYLDNRHNIIHFAIEFQGTVDMAAVYPGKLLNRRCYKTPPPSSWHIITLVVRLYQARLI